MADPLRLDGFNPSTILGMLGDAPPANPMDAVLGGITQKYPALAGQPWAILDSRGKTAKYGGGLEFYPPEESENPRPGSATVEVFDPKLEGDALETAIFGDMLHHMPAADPYYAKMRESLRSSLTPEQLAVDRKEHQRAQKEDDEQRSFDDWMSGSRLDAYVRGKLTPDKADEWRDVYTPEQGKILADMLKYLTTSTKQTSAP